MEQDRETHMGRLLGWILITLIFCGTAQATVLWAGGEDIDFPNGGAVCSTTNTVYFRNGYARQGIFPCAQYTVLISNPFKGGPITSAWISSRIYMNDCCQGSQHFFGLSKSGATGSLWVGNYNANQLALYSYDGSNWNMLATESTPTFNTGGTLNKVDMQVINYGSNATVNIYLNGGTLPRITFTGNVAPGTATNLDSVVTTSTNYNVAQSEFIVSDSDTRSLSLATLAPAGTGDTNQWTGTYSNINPISINDSSTISDTNAGDNFQCTMNALPTGTFTVVGVKIAARAIQTGSGLSSISVGVKTNSSISVPSSVSLPTTWSEVETYYSTNPVTATTWTSSDINSLQIDLKSAP
jgi:hypothetical protein